MPEGYLAGCIHELFEKQAEKTPGTLAIQCRGERLTYRDLNTRANRIAHDLQRRGVGPEVFVGLQMGRSIEAVIALLGVLKAGGAYVHLDPSYPETRRGQIVDDSRPLLVLTEVESAGDDDSNPRSAVTLDNASYLIYTSGSTGVPKGVVEIHRSMTSRLVAAPLPDIQAGDICCLNSSLSFGISASRLFLPLVSGVPVVILTDEDVRDVGRFVFALEAHAITSVFMVPAVLRQILLTGPEAAARLQRLRAVAVSGGSLTREIAQAFFTLLPGAILVNVYGGSEIGTAAALSVLDAKSDLTRITVGRAVANTRIDLVDGEICVAAPHLARGYLNQPELTAERFIPDPSNGEPALLSGVRMYRTGDLGRLLPNGEIEFLGRVDQQVKIRGFRVEMGEIEAVLHAHEDIEEAAVTAHEVNGDKRLTAYIVARPEARLSISVLRDYLGVRLPYHMIPGAICFLYQLPRTDNGKVDRGALLPLAECRGELDSVYQAPRTEIECGIVEIWEELLQIRPVGIHDHFIEFGGDSLTATELIARIWQRYDVQVEFRSLFERPTIAELAEEVEALLRSTSRAAAP